MSTHVDTYKPYMFFNFNEEQSVELTYYPASGKIEVEVCKGPDERGSVYRDIPGSMSVIIPQARASDFLVEVQTWIEQLPIGGGDGARGHRSRAAVES